MKRAKSSEARELVEMESEMWRQERSLVVEKGRSSASPGFAYSQLGGAFPTSKTGESPTTGSLHSCDAGPGRGYQMFNNTVVWRVVERHLPRI